MPSIISSALLLGAATLTIVQSCSFGLAASGGEIGTLGQLADGQIRIGGGYSPSIFTIVDGTILDPNGFGCILTPGVEQFQCDYDTPGILGFTIASNGSLEYDGNAVFYACPSSDVDWNVYKIPVPGQEKCVEVTLTANNCYPTTTTTSNGCSTITVGSCASSSKSYSITSSTSSSSVPSSSSTRSSTTSSTSSTISTTTSAKTCATTLTGTTILGNFQSPSLIVPISSSDPYIPTGTSLFGTVSSTTSTIFDFTIPFTYEGDTCSLIFLLPLQSQLQLGAAYTFTGNGAVVFKQLSSIATLLTDYSNAPAASANLGTFTLTEGSSTLVSTFACQAGQTVAYEMSGVGNTYLHFLQDANPSALGIYITYC